MSSLLLLRHGATEWSRSGRIQGRTDTELCAQGLLDLQQRRLPPEFAGWRCCSSPLRRCVQTGEALGLHDVASEPRIIEMDWGDWEGRSLAELRIELADSMRQNEVRGWDFRPNDGESPREVYQRVHGWLLSLAESDQPAMALTHRGVIRVVLAKAYGWDMLGRAPVKLDWQAAHLFRIDRAGQPHPVQMNISLQRPQADGAGP